MKTPQAGAVERSGLQSCIGDKDHIENTAPVDQVCYFFYSIFFCFISPDRLFLFFLIVLWHELIQHLGI